jgi:putative flippase GtrA
MEQSSTSLSRAAEPPYHPEGFMGRLGLYIVNRFMGGGDKKAREMERFLKFLVVGTIGFVVDFGTLNVLLLILKPESGSVLILVCSTIAFLAAVINNFIWNRYWTYPDSRSKSLTGQLVMFTVINAVGLVIRSVILALLQPLMYKIIDGIASNAEESFLVNMSSSMALAVAVIVVLFWNFFINRYWTYSDVK